MHALTCVLFPTNAFFQLQLPGILELQAKELEASGTSSNATSAPPRPFIYQLVLVGGTAPDAPHPLQTFLPVDDLVTFTDQLNKIRFEGGGGSVIDLFLIKFVSF
jgi:hypothetical protein